MIISEKIEEGSYRHHCDCCQDFRVNQFPKLRFKCKCQPGQECVKTKIKEPSFFKKVKNFAKAQVKHIMAGSPECTDEQVAKRYAICKACPLFRFVSEDEGVCRHPSCGCPLKAVGTKGRNKLRYKDQQCPIYDPDHVDEKGNPDPKGWPRLDVQLPIIQKT